jgi:hypothetical protein
MPSRSAHRREYACFGGSSALSVPKRTASVRSLASKLLEQFARIVLLREPLTGGLRTAVSRLGFGSNEEGPPHGGPSSFGDNSPVMRLPVRRDRAVWVAGQDEPRI